MAPVTAYGRILPRIRGIRLECAVLAAFVLLRTIHSYGTYVSHSREIIVDHWPGAMGEAGLVALLLWMAWASGDEVTTLGLKRPGWIDAAFMAIGFVACGIEHFIRILLRTGGAARAASFLSFDVVRAAGMLPVFLIPALLEELIYRGLIQARFSEALRSPWAGILISALLFMSTHVYQGTSALPWHFGFGLFMAILRWRGASIWTLTLIHAASNAMLSGIVPRLH